MGILSQIRHWTQPEPVSLINYYDDLLAGTALAVTNEVTGATRMGHIKFVDVSPYAGEDGVLRAYWVADDGTFSDWLDVGQVCEELGVA